MINAFLTFLLSQSILIPILIGWIRFNRMGNIYYPSFILLILGFVNEVISYILIRGFKLHNSVTSNTYSLIECCLILYQLYVWQNSKKGYKLFVVLINTCVGVWIVQYIFFLKLNTFSSPYFMVFYAFIIVLLSINHINRIMMRSRDPLLKNPQIIICVAFITFYIYQIIYEASKFMSDKSAIRLMLITGFAFINYATNILYAFAVYLMTIKRKENYYGYFNDR